MNYLVPASAMLFVNLALEEKHFFNEEAIHLAIL
jgi:hypothetical protein